MDLSAWCMDMTRTTKLRRPEFSHLLFSTIRCIFIVFLCALHCDCFCVVLHSSSSSSCHVVTNKYEYDAGILRGGETHSFGSMHCIANKCAEMHRSVWCMGHARYIVQPLPRAPVSVSVKRVAFAYEL